MAEFYHDQQCKKNTCNGVAQGKCCAKRKYFNRLAGPYAHPNDHPVTENILPADPMVIVRSHISANEQILVCTLSLYIIHSYTSSHTQITSHFLLKSAMILSSSLWKKEIAYLSFNVSEIATTAAIVPTWYRLYQSDYVDYSE